MAEIADSVLDEMLKVLEDHEWNTDYAEVEDGSCAVSCNSCGVEGRERPRKPRHLTTCAWAKATGLVRTLTREANGK